ncbi:MAG: gliding motility-associated C-terminal domain-containing protein [Saprospiraceae bacterium]
MFRNFTCYRCIFTLILTITFIFLGQSQDAFHRTYKSDNGRDIVVLAGTQTKAGNYLMACVEEFKNSLDTINTDTLIISAFNPKGNVLWSRRFALKDQRLNAKYGKASLYGDSKDSLYYFSFVSTVNDESYKTTGSFLNRNGSLDTLIFQKINAGSIGSRKYQNLNVNQVYNNSSFNIYNSGNAAYVQRQAYDRNVDWSKKLSLSLPEFGALSSLQMTQDTNLLLTGYNTQAFLTEMDTLGNALMSMTYKTNTSALIPIGADKYQDTMYRLAGNYDESIFFLTTDTSSTAINGTLYSIPGDTLQLLDMVKDISGDHVYLGKWHNSTDKKLYHFVLKFNADGTLAYKKYFDRIEGSRTEIASLIASVDGGIVIFASQIEGSNVIPAIIKLDPVGKSLCEKDMPDLVSTIIQVSESKVNLQTENYQPIYASFSNHEKVYSFDVPTLSVETKTFCSNEPINWLFDANVSGLTMEPKYLWDNTVTTDTLRVMDTEKHTIMVTIDEKVCFILCDTVKLELYPEPQVAINESYADYCEDEKVKLTAFLTDGLPPAKSFKWSTGETTSTISVPFGTYSVTVTDGCDLSTTKSISIADPRLKSVKIDTSKISDCVKGASATLTASGETNLSPLSFIWNTGETSSTIKVEDIENEAIYVVTVTDRCNNTAVANVTIINDRSQIIKNLDGSYVDTSLICQKILGLNVLADPGSNVYSYIWSTGSINPNINISEEGIYTVTVTDICGFSLSKSFEITSNQLLEYLKYPNVFFPNGVGTVTDTVGINTRNRAFGPANTFKCPINITDYEMIIVNRWGQEVYTSNRIEDEWDGMFKSEPAPPDTYIYAVRYRFNGLPVSIKGDVTLIR